MNTNGKAINPYNGPSMPMPKITRADIEVMYAWGIRLSDWSRLPEHKRVEYRTNVAQVTKPPRLDSPLAAGPQDWNF